MWRPQSIIRGIITRIVMGIMSAKQWRFCGQKGGPHLAWDGGAQTFSRPGVAMLKISSWQPLLDREDLPPVICRVDGKSYFVSKKYYLLGSLSKSKMGMDVGDVG